jgi:hypothetical protein
MRALDRVDVATRMSIGGRGHRFVAISHLGWTSLNAAATIKAYFYDPTGDKARAVKARHVGACRGCGAYTRPRNGKGDAYPYCKACHPGSIERRWTREQVLAAMGESRSRYGWLPSPCDWSRTHARRRGGEALERLAACEWPAASVVSRLFGAWGRRQRGGLWERPATGDGPRAGAGAAVGQQLDLAA